MNECPLCGAAFPTGVSRCPECCIDFSSVVQPGGVNAAPAPGPMERTAEPIPLLAVPPPPVPEATPMAAFLEPPLPALEIPRTSPVVELPRSNADLKLPQPPTVVDQGKPRSDTIRFRPVRRPPMAMVCAVDDGREDGQWVRIRTPNFVIGRTEGDLIIPHDSMMSSRHAAIVRQLEKDRYRWHLTDLGSTNGTYLKIASMVLHHGQEVLIGGRRLRFDAAPQGGGGAEGKPPAATQGWQTVGPTDVIPSLVEVSTQGEGPRYFLNQTDNWIGREPTKCTIVLANDPLVDARHARLHRDAKGRWRLDNNKSTNGTWLRIDKVSLDGTGQFLLGEQRFLVKFP